MRANFDEPPSPCDEADDEERLPASLELARAGHLRDEPDELGRGIDAGSLTTPHLQRELAILVEAVGFDEFMQRAAAADDRAARRVAELADAGTCHDWLWKLNPRDGSRLADEDFSLAFSSRFGAVLVDASTALCRRCGEPLDAAAGHGLCCARAENTRGHYAVVAAVADGIALADPAFQTEVRGLVPSSDRPADILTIGALPGVQTALDVTIAAQDACAAGSDACASAYRRKIRRYASILPALRRAGVVFQPLVWSAEGRPHPATTRILDCVIRAVSGRRGKEAAEDLRARWRHEIAIALQRRKAAMLRAVLPRGTWRQEWLARGSGPCDTEAEVRLTAIEGEEDEDVGDE